MAKPPANIVPTPTPIYRIIHIDNLPVYLTLNRLHAPNHMPAGAPVWKKIEDETVQAKRYETALAKGPGGTILDYVPFYFGPRSPMLLRLATKHRVNYTGTQEEIIYLYSTVQEMVTKQRKFVFSDGHGLAAYTDWYDDLKDLNKVDWKTVYADVWKNTPDDNNRMTRKQAEFLVHQSCGWGRILEVGVMTPKMKARVETVLKSHPSAKVPPVCVRKAWYYEGK